jgi:hypothetical protein
MVTRAARVLRASSAVSIGAAAQTRASGHSKHFGARAVHNEEPRSISAEFRSFAPFGTSSPRAVSSI